MERIGHFPATAALVFMGLAYFLTAGLGLGLTHPATQTATFWPALGVLVAALLLHPSRRWPLLLTVAAILHILAWVVFQPGPVLLILGAMLGEILEALLAAAGVRAIVGVVTLPINLRTLFAVVGCAGLLAPLVGATLSTLARAETDPRVSAVTTWPTNWFADLLGIVIMVPLILGSMTKLPQLLRRSSRVRWVESGLMLGISLLLGVFVFWEPFTALSFTYLVPLVLLWPAFRSGVFGVAVIFACMVPIAILGMLRGYGPVAEEAVSPQQQLLLLQAFLATHAVTFLVLATVLSERRQAVLALAEANADLEERVRRRTADLHHANLGLLEKQKLFERIAEATPDVLYLQDLTTGRNVYANSQASKITGYTPEQLIALGEQVLDRLLLPEDLPQIQNRIRELATTPDGTVTQSQFRIRTVDGRIRWVQSRAVIFTRLPDGTAHLALGLLRDITDEKAVAEALTESASHYRALADTSPGFRWVMSPTGEVVSANSRWSFFFGQQPTHGQPTAWHDILHPDDRARVMQRLQHHLADKTPFEEEFRLRRQDGEYRWFLTRSVPVAEADGEITRWYGTGTDIQTRKLAELALHDSEAHYRAVFDQTTLGIVLCLTDGRFLSMNRGFLDLLGYSVEELAECTILDLIAPADRASVQTAVETMLAQNGKTVTIEHGFVRKDQSIVPVQVNVTAVRGGEDRFTHTIAVVQDISQRQLVEASIRGAEAHLRNVLDSLFTFVAVLTPDGTLLDSNRAPLDAAGLDREEIIGQKFWELAPWAYDATVQSGLREACERAAAGEASRYDVALQMAGGRLLTVDFLMTPLRDAQGVVTHLVPSAVDVTARVELASALRTALKEIRSHRDNSPMAIVEWDPEFCVKHWTGRAEQIFGWTAAEVLGKRPEEWHFVHEQDSVSVGDTMTELVAGHRLNNYCRNRNYRKDGTVVTCAWYNSAFWDEAGALVSVLSRILEVSDPPTREVRIPPTEEQLG
ncbi:MAG: PAS domain S-box protein [Bacteroidales bacterium]|nr:PAS domain S-box protein [Bacteroidales bacterium]